MYFNIMVEDSFSSEFPLVYTWSQSSFTVYNLRPTYRPDSLIPKESLVSPRIEEGCIEYAEKYWEVNGTVCNLNALHDWHFGSVYAIIERDYYSDQSSLFGSVKRARHSLVNMTPIMVNHDCSDVVAAYTVYRDSQPNPELLRLCGFLIVISDKRTVQDNILITLTTNFERELSLRAATRYEDFNIGQAFRDIENECIWRIDLECQSSRPSVFHIESISRDNGGWAVNPVQINEPFCADFAINQELVSAEGFIPYYTIGCMGIGRLTVNDHCYHASRLVLQLSNPAIRYNARLDVTAPRLVTQWLFKHEYHLIEDYRGDETKVHYQRYY